MFKNLNHKQMFSEIGVNSELTNLKKSKDKTKKFQDLNNRTVSLVLEYCLLIFLLNCVVNLFVILINSC